MERTDEAKAVFDQAQSKGAKGDGFDQIEQRLGLSDFKKLNNQDLPQDKLEALMSLFNQKQTEASF